MEQTVEAGSVATLVVNVVDNSGAHVAATIDTANTRLQKGNASDSTWNSITPTVDTITTGVYRINFSSVTPELSLADNDDHVRVRINGSIDGGSAWSEYHLPIRVVPATPRAVVRASVVTTTTLPTTTQFSTSLAADEPFEGRTLVFTSGTNQHLALKITAAALVSSELSLTVEMHDGSAMPAAPGNGDTFEVI